VRLSHHERLDRWLCPPRRSTETGVTDRPGHGTVRCAALSTHVHLLHWHLHGHCSPSLAAAFRRPPSPLSMSSLGASSMPSLLVESRRHVVTSEPALDDPLDDPLDGPLPDSPLARPVHRVLSPVTQRSKDSSKITRCGISPPTRNAARDASAGIRVGSDVGLNPE
jgi:hypothetical protein